MDKLVSIILPVYKVSAYLEECIRSLMAQDYKNLEIIPVDDGSPDDCGAILDRLAAEDPRIKPIHKANGGAASARNVGIDAATGDYICFVDSDDKAEANYIFHLVQTLEAEQADIAVCGFYYWSQKDLTPCNGETPAGVYEDRAYLAQFVKDWSCSLLWNKLYRRETVGNIRMAEGHRVDDEYFTYQVVMNARKVVVTTPHLYRYRMRQSSVMQSTAQQQERYMLDRIAYITQRYNDIATLIPELEHDFFRDAVGNMARYWHLSKDMPAAQKVIRTWINTHRGKLMKSNMSIKQKIGFLIRFYVKKPQMCGVYPDRGAKEGLYFS